MVKNYVSGHPR